jgi:uncharacterized membrane protein/protein-disulfide isomerase
MTPITRKLLLTFAALGLAASTVSAYVHHRLLTQPGYESFCDVSSGVSCTQAYLSPYGSIAGIPVAVAGVAFFAAVLLLAGFGGRPRSAIRDAVAAYILVFSLVGLAFVVYLGWASYVQLRVFCFVCATTYLAVIGLVVVAWRAARAPLSTLPGRAAGDLRVLVARPAALAATLAIAVGAVALAASFRQPPALPPAQAVSYPPLTDQQRYDLQNWWNLQPVTPLPIPAAGAKVVIVKFSDYMCPACRSTYEGYKPILAKYAASGNVRYVVKHFPLESECNPAAPGNHFASCEAAAAVVLARSKGTAAALEQWIFTNQASLTPAAVKEAAGEVGHVSDFDQQYASALREVRSDADLGATLKVERTPTFYINGRKIDAVLPPQFFDYLIELALKDPGLPPSSP